MDILSLIVLFVGGLLLGYFLTRKTAKVSQPEPETKKPTQKRQTQPSQPKQQKQVPKPAASAVHPACASQLKNKDEVYSLSWDPKNRFLVATTTNAILLYDTTTLEGKDHSYKVNIQGESPDKVTFSTKGFFVVSYKDSRALEAYATFSKKTEEGKLYKLLRKFPGQNYGDLTALQVTSDGKNIMTCAKDTTVCMWGLKGDCLDKLQTKQLAYNMAVISPNGKYLAIATAMSDIKLHNLSYSSPVDTKGKGKVDGDTTSTFTSIEKVHFTRLDGHNGGINYLQFTPDSKRVLSASKDGTWKLWNLEVDYKGGFVPKVIFEGENPAGKSFPYGIVLISPDNKIFAASHGKEVHFWSLTTGKAIELYTNSHDGYIKEMSWSPDSTRLATLATDNLIRIFKTPTA